MSQRNVELLIGRLLTDEEFRGQFALAPFETLTALRERGCELTRGEIDALVGTDAHLWGKVAAKLPSRLQRCTLRCSPVPPGGTDKGPQGVS
jgi:hypothetical protein